MRSRLTQNLSCLIYKGRCHSRQVACIIPVINRRAVGFIFYDLRVPHQCEAGCKHDSYEPRSSLRLACPLVHDCGQPNEPKSPDSIEQHVQVRLLHRFFRLYNIQGPRDCVPSKRLPFWAAHKGLKIVCSPRDRQEGRRLDQCLSGLPQIATQRAGPLTLKPP